jgi:hypothetical protein
MQLLLVLNFAVAAYLTGLIWLVQVRLYPRFGRVSREEWMAFHQAHTRRLGFVAAGPMVAELLLALALAWVGRAALPGGAGWWALALVGVVWAATFGVAVPFHRRLAQGFDYVAIDGLTRTNWLRTLAWTARILLLGWLLARPYF